MQAEFWKPLKAYWKDKTKENGDALRNLLTIDATKWQYTHGVRNTELISPDNWNIDQRLLDDQTLAFADFVGNAQYISTGNLDENNKAFIFLMDYPNRRRIKIWGTTQVIEDDDQLLEQLTDLDYRGKPERVFLFQIEAWDVIAPNTLNQVGQKQRCPQSLTSCEHASETSKRRTRSFARGRSCS